MSIVSKKIAKSLVIVGAGGHAANVTSVAMANGYDIRAYVETGTKGQILFNAPIIQSIDDLGDYQDYVYAIAIGDNSAREKIAMVLVQKYREIYFPSIVHPSADISPLSSLGDGCILMPNVIVGGNTQIGNFCILGNQSCIAHDSIMSTFASLGPGAITGGSVKIGLRGAVGIGAVVDSNIQIGDDCVLGSSSFLNKNLPKNKVAYGIPAKVVKNRSAGDPYL